MQEGMRQGAARIEWRPKERTVRRCLEARMGARILAPLSALKRERKKLLGALKVLPAVSMDQGDI